MKSLCSNRNDKTLCAKALCPICIAILSMSMTGFFCLQTTTFRHLSWPLVHNRRKHIRTDLNTSTTTSSQPQSFSKSSFSVLLDYVPFIRVFKRRRSYLFFWKVLNRSPAKRVPNYEKPIHSITTDLSTNTFTTHLLTTCLLLVKVSLGASVRSIKMTPTL